MGLQRAMWMLLLVGICLSFQSSEAHTLAVGGKDGWVVHPSEDYSHWSSRLRFSVNDTLYFKYEEGEDSVLVVKREDFYMCNIMSPILKMGSGSSYFKLNRSGPFYFISGVNDKCGKGQKLLVVVLSEHHHAGSYAPSPSVHPPAVSPSQSPSPRVSPSPAPMTPSPKVSPAPAPFSRSPGISPTPASTSPSPSPSPKVSPAPRSPGVSPAPATPSPTPTPATPSPSPEAAAAAPTPVEESPAPAPGQNAASKMMIALPVTFAFIACSFLLI